MAHKVRTACKKTAPGLRATALVPARLQAGKADIVKYGL